ncbi:MAG: tRNA uridine-5-carboxymethylaminomethyl(34) synthesis GTPase MnmE [Chitinophagaceae bacterium]|nr:MAG: tRNA uridine-5-carboxymethylaminomethyl(34) synthesis GTPase MnmE [Chitinophagaceae bacterium]
MNNNLSGWDDTIIALATPPGIGAIGVIRLSGKNSFPIVNELFPSKDLLQVPSHTLHVGYLQENGKPIDEVVLSLFRGPRSYTGEDVIEISCHGSPYIHQQVMEACIRKGARLAKPGEFTQRAFLAGKMDLAQAESVADIIASNTAASHKAALHAMRGGFSAKLRDLREQLIRFAALIELELDFSQEDVEFADRGAFYSLVNELRESTGQLIDSFRLGNVIRNGVSVAIIGKPNAGKSTLLNTLLNENRAIVSDIPGTTRDTIEEVINIGGILFRLIDTAGIRQHTSDVIESAGVERSLEKMKQADLVLYLFDASDDIAEIEQRVNELKMQGTNYLLVANKIDQLSSYKEKFAGWGSIIFISARQHLNVDALKQEMTEKVLEGQVQAENNIVTNARHYEALKAAAQSLEDIKKGLDSSLPGDLLAPDIRRALHYLGEITGQVSNEDMLDYVFSKFCIGK